MSEQFSRMEILYGREAIEKLSQARVAVFGLGGVGGYIAEALARSGVGAIDLIDNDTIAESNLNRQIIALHSTIGMKKTDVAAGRILDINPNCSVTKHELFYIPETAGQIDLSQFDYVADAIDTVSGKIEIIVRCNSLGVPVISCMGTGNKIHPEMIEVTDIYKTTVCPLARVMRRELRKRGIKKLNVVYSKEEPRPGKTPSQEDNCAGRRSIPGSSAFVPPAAGLAAAAKIVNDILKS